MRNLVDGINGSDGFITPFLIDTTMKYFKLTAQFLALAVVFYSCNKHEVIPAPVPKADLETHFIGTIGGSEIELTENVNGYAGTSAADFIISAGGVDSAVYYSTFSSNVSSLSITIGHGSVEFDSGSSSSPTLSAFNNFYNNNLTPMFSTNGKNGFTVTYVDGNNRTWQSNEDHLYPGESVEYTNVSQESDNTGDYTKYTVTFNTYVYSFNVVTGMVDQLLITDAVYKGWYKR